jgi:pimeloyl-ACP methyl ester carboxylesterase
MTSTAGAAATGAIGGSGAKAGGPVHEEGYVPIRGTMQWISIAGAERTNPILLVLHGGPGASFEPLARDAWRPWLKHFTVVHWDQPGSGRTHARHGALIGALTLDRIVEDGLAVAEYIRARLPSPRLVLLGASWGSVVGLQMARRRPALFSVYVGAGQVVDMSLNESVGYDALADRLRLRKARRALAQLKAIGPPPYPDLQTVLAQRRILMAHPPASERGVVRRSLWRMLRAGYGPRQIGTWMDAQRLSGETLFEAMFAFREPEAPTLPIPAVFLQGAEDIQTPTTLVADYHDRLAAPAKSLVILPHAGHSALLFMPGPFLSALRDAIAPFVRD